MFTSAQRPTTTVRPPTPAIMTVRKMLRPVLAASRQVRDRALHSFRRRAAHAAAASQPRPKSILVVCHGNICRSPFAEAALRREFRGTPVSVGSAGFIGPGRQPPPNALSAAAGRGIDMTNHRSRVLEPGLVRHADLVITMDLRQARDICQRYGKPPKQVVLLGDFDPKSSDGRTIMDPVDLPVEVFDRVYARIEQCAEQLAGAILGVSESSLATSE